MSMSLIPIVRLQGQPLWQRLAELRKELHDLDHADSPSQREVAQQRSMLDGMIAECRRHQHQQMARLVLAMVRRLEGKASPRATAADAMACLEDILGKDEMLTLVEEVH